jgi:hypothetical protein
MWPKGPLFEEATGGEPQGGGAGGSGEQQQQQQQPDPNAELEALRKENESLKTRASEAEETARYWHGQVRGSTQSRGSDRDRGDDDHKPEPDQDDTDLLELAGKGPEAMKAWLKKSGFVSAAEVETITNAKAQQLVKEAELTRRYPDLQDHDSEFFKATAKQYAILKGRGIPPAEAMEIAAEQAELAQFRAGKTAAADTTKGGGKKTESDEERQARIKAQNGGSGRRSAAREDENDELTPEQLQICDAMGISPDAYKKRAKEGVRVARTLD